MLLDGLGHAVEDALRQDDLALGAGQKVGVQDLLGGGAQFGAGHGGVLVVLVVGVGVAACG